LNIKAGILQTVVLICSLLLLPTPARNQNSDRRDGNWWRGQSEYARTVYVTGFFDGILLGNSFSYWGFVHDGKTDNQSAFSAVNESFEQYYGRYLRDVTNAQLADGLTTFYSDYRNRRILISNAIWLVLNEISGKSEDEMKKMIENWRKNAD